MINKRKIFSVLTLVFLLGILSACSGNKENKVDIIDYVSVEYTGLNGNASAQAFVDEDSLVKDIFEVDTSSDIEDKDLMKDVKNLLTSYKIDIKPNEDLKNGDKIEVLVTVDEDKTKSIKDSKKKFTVENLDEGIGLSDEELKDNVEYYFEGMNGKGEIYIENKFKDVKLKDIRFNVEENGSLSIGDEAVIKVLNVNYLDTINYVLTGEGSFTIKVDNLINVPASSKGIANLEEITQRLKEEVATMYKSLEYSNIFYETVNHGLYYRHLATDQHQLVNDWNSRFSEDIKKTYGNGVLLTLVEITESSYNINDEIISSETYFAVVGYPSVVLDSDNNADFNSLGTALINYVFEKEYSIETVQSQLKSEGFIKE